MKLKSKTFYITDAQGNEINVEDQNIVLALNGKKLEAGLQNVFNPAYLEFNDGEIYGNTLLSYYTVNEDGSLSVEGSQIQFINSDTNESVLVKEIAREGSFNDDEVISFEFVKKFADYFKVEKPDEVFYDLNNDEKQYFIDERIAIAENNKQATAAALAKAKADEKEAADKAKAEADRIVKENIKAEAERNAAIEAENLRLAKKAEENLKASIDPKFVHDKKDYKKEQVFYNEIGFKEYISNPYHLFYAKSDEHEPHLLIRRGETWWEESFDPIVIDETDTTVLIQFTDGEALKQINLDTNTGEIKITDAGA